MNNPNTPVSPPANTEKVPDLNCASIEDSIHNCISPGLNEFALATDKVLHPIVKFFEELEDIPWFLM